ncbi:MAG: YdcF family protein, partial [Longimicrobiales bacterium]
PILTGLARFLTVRDELRPADAIFLLNGDIESRPAGAAELFHRGLAPVIVLAREEETTATRTGLMPNRSDVAVALLRRFGVPESAIIMLTTEDGVSSTIDEARAFRAYAARTRPDVVILVTNGFHSRRARWTLRHALQPLGVEVLASAVPHRHFDETNWWRTESGLIFYLQEFIKFAHYRLNA